MKIMITNFRALFVISAKSTTISLWEKLKLSFEALKVTTHNTTNEPHKIILDQRKKQARNFIEMLTTLIYSNYSERMNPFIGWYNKIC
jgi:hypothetical protein